MLITISGAIGAGKDTFGEMLVDAFDAFGYRADTAKFAEPLREVAFACGFNPDRRETKETPAIRDYTLSALSDAVFKTMVYLDPFHRRLVACTTHQRLLRIRKVKHNGIYLPNVSCREFLQTLGGVVRGYDENYFKKHLSLEYTPTQVMIITDCRHLNEQEMGFYKIYIYRDNNNYSIQTNDISEKYHRELEDSSDITVDNYTSKEDLYDEARAIARNLINEGYCEDAKKPERTGGIMCDSGDGEVVK